MAGFPAYAPALALDSPGFEKSFFEQLAAIEFESFWFTARNKLIVWAAEKYVPESASVLEIGCGTGFVLKGLRDAMPEAAFVATEIFVEGLRFAQTRVPDAHYLQMDAQQMPFTAEFDLVGAFDVLEHISDDRAVLRNVHRALRSGGVLLLTVPQHPALWSAQDVTAGHVRRYTADDLRSKLELEGFEIVRQTSFVSLLLPFMLLSRRRVPASSGITGFDVAGDMRLPRLVDRPLRLVMAAERALIKLGVSFPAGGSLLVVARLRDTENRS